MTNTAPSIEFDTDNKSVFGLTCNQIRDFCADAIRSGRLPYDYEIETLVGDYEITKVRKKLFTNGRTH